MSAFNSSRSILPYIEINGVSFIAESWNCTRPAYGSVGSFRAQVSREVLNSAELNLFNVGSQATSQVPVYIKVTENGQTTTLWGGEMDTVSTHYDSDTVTISGRDWAGLLVDTKRPIQSTQVVGGTTQSFTPGATNVAATGAAVADFTAAIGSAANVQNKTPSQIAYYIAARNSFLPQVYTYPNEPEIGALFSGLHVNASSPRTEWSILQYMARLLGWVCFVTPTRQLYFGPFTAGTPLDLSWKQSPVPDGMLPCNDLEITYNPRRNSNFLVVVESFDLETVARTTGVVGVAHPGTISQVLTAFPQVNVQNNRFIVGTAGTSSGSSLGALFTALGKPVYVYTHPNLNVSQAEQQAFSMALELAKRELIMRCRVDGSATLTPLQTVRMHGDLGDFAGQDYYVNSLEHSFDLDEGWYTHLHGWTLGPQGPNGAFLQATEINGVVTTNQTPVLMTSANG